MRYFLIILMLLMAGAPARADDAPDCAAAFRDYMYGPWSIAKGMADYKAALDAGYEGCSENNPQAFDETEALHDFMEQNTDREMDEARDVVDYLIDHADDSDVPAVCLDDKETINEVRKDVHAGIDGQYQKAYQRRLKMLTEDEGQADEAHDSCGLVLKMLKQYKTYYGRYDQLRNVLYESSKKKGKVQLAGSTRRASFKKFEAARAELAKDKP